IIVGLVVCGLFNVVTSLLPFRILVPTDAGQLLFYLLLSPVAPAIGTGENGLRIGNPLCITLINQVGLGFAIHAVVLSCCSEAAKTLARRPRQFVKTPTRLERKWIASMN